MDTWDKVLSGWSVLELVKAVSCQRSAVSSELALIVAALKLIAEC